MQDDNIILGQVNGIYGVQGWVKVFSHTEPRDNILTYSPWRLRIKGQWRTVMLEDGRSQSGGKSIIAKIEGVADRDQARELMGCEIAIDPKQLPASEDGYYWRQLIGCDVVNQQGETLGQVTEIVETGAHDVLRVASDSATNPASSILIPFVMDAFILNVDIDGRKIAVDWVLDEDSHTESTLQEASADVTD
ncbi:MAG: ribosome maturation factor RimM [Hydrogenovibrio sp.]